MIEKEVKIIMWHILMKLQNMRKWGGAHSEIKRVIKSIPDRLMETSEGKRLVKKAIKNLTNSGFISIYKKTGEDHISLNSKMGEEIKKFIKEVKENVIGNEYVK